MDVSRKLLQQRIRNRVIENLESFADPVWVRKLGTDEIINMWYDHMDDDEDFTFFTEPVFNLKETNAIKRFHYLLESTYKTIPTTWSLSDLSNNQEWKQLTIQAHEELSVFMERGRFSEEAEIT